MKRDYTYPALEIYSIATEKGFALSFGVEIVDYSKNDDDLLDD